MKKQELISIIQKYSLNNRVQSTVWKILDGQLVIDFIGDDKSILGRFESKSEIEDTELGIYDSDALQKLLSALDDEFTLNIQRTKNKPTALQLEDSGSEMTFCLSDIDMIESSKQASVKINQLSANEPKYDIVFELDKSFIDRFIKGVNALKASTFTFMTSYNENDVDIIIGYDKNTETNKLRLTITLENPLELSEPITFIAETVRDTFNANKDFQTAKIYVSSEGLMKLNFGSDDFNSTYYIKPIQN